MNDFQIFNLRSRHPQDIDQLLLLKNGEWFLLKEELRPVSNTLPVRLVLKISMDNLALFFHNRDVEVIPIVEETRKLLVSYGIV